MTSAGESASSSSEALNKHAAQREELLDAYFRETKLLQVLQAPLTKLATDFKAQHVLPASPFPQVLQTIRQAEIKRALELRGIQLSVPSSITAPVFLLHEQQQQQRASVGDSSSFQLRTTQELLEFGLWSFVPVLERLDADVLARRAAAIRTANQRTASWFAATELENDGDYKVAVYGVLVGNENHFALADVPVVELERHVTVAGDQLEQAMTVFARQLVKCLHEHSVSLALTEKDPAGNRVAAVGDAIWHGGIHITPCVAASETSDQETASTAWTVESVNKNRNAFNSAVKLALVRNAGFEITSFCQTCHSHEVAAGGVLLRTTQRFFFHFEFRRATAVVTTKIAVTQQQRRSFLEGSRVCESGVFLDGLGAFEITRRVQIVSESATAGNDKKKNASTKPKSDQKAAPRAATTHAREGYAWQTRASELVDRLLATLKLHCSASPGAFRHWVKCFSHCYAFVLLRLALHIEVLIDALEVCTSATGSVDITSVMVGAHIARIGQLVETLVSQARVGSESSLAKSVASMLEALWRGARDNFAVVVDSDLQSGDPDTNECVEQLERLNALLVVIARTAVRDFVELFLSHQSSRSENATPLNASQSTVIFQTESADAEQIDVLRALRSAVHEREYPRIVAFESVFAQFVVDSCVDIALESAVMNIVAFHLPPNPFVELSHKLRVFAMRQLVWSCPLSGAGQDTATSPKAGTRDAEDAKLQSVSRSDLVHTRRTSDRSSRRVLYGHNSKLVETLDAPVVWRALEWLQSREVVLASCDYHPPKGSYSARTFHSLLLFHPMAYAFKQERSAALVSKLEVVELVVLEGREFAQALEFFADAVTRDLRRLIAVIASTGAAHMEVSVLDGVRGLVVSDVDCTRNDDAKIRGLVQEATLSACVMHVKITLFIERGGDDQGAVHSLVHVVGKTFVFHHEPTDSSEMQQDHNVAVSELLAFRVEQFGVFFSSDSAEFVLKLFRDAGVGKEKTKLPRAIWTPFASHALESDDQLLKYELDFGAPPGASLLTRYHAVDDHKRGTLRQRLVAHSSILQLHALVRCSRFSH